MPECRECGDYFTLDDGCDDDGLCHPCAHKLAVQHSGLSARMTLVANREAELHYAIRQTAGLVDHKLSEEEAHAMALRIVEKMRDVWQAAHDVDEAFSRDAPMMLVDTGAVAERKLERMRVVLDRPVSGPST